MQQERKDPLQSVMAIAMQRNLTPMAALNTLVPSVFTTTRRPDCTSERYSVVPTSEIVEHMQLRGWQIDKAGESLVRSYRKRLAPYVAHVVTFQHPDFQFGKLKKGDVVPTILMGNSHDTSTAVWMRMGMKRCFCDNQACVELGETSVFRFRHQGGVVNLMDKIYASLEKLMASKDIVGKTLDRWASIDLKEKQRIDYFGRVLALRTDKPSSYAEMGLSLFDIGRRRPEDQSNDLYTVYNVAQEHMVRGYRTEVLVQPKGRSERMEERSLVRPLSSTRAFVKFNAELFGLTAKYADEVKA
jgi:hypothetical protein